MTKPKHLYIPITLARRAAVYDNTQLDSRSAARCELLSGSTTRELKSSGDMYQLLFGGWGDLGGTLPKHMPLGWLVRPGII